MLNQNPVLYIPSESGFLNKLRQQDLLYGDFTQPYQRWFFIRDLQTNKATSKTFSFPIFKLTVEEAEAALSLAAPTDYPGAASALFTASACKQGKKQWGDKTPRNVFEISWLAKAFPHAKFVHIIRDGRDVAASVIKAGWVNNFIQAARYWQERVEAGMSVGSALSEERYYELRYEKLVTFPEETLKLLCHWLEIEYVPQMLKQHKNATDYISRDYTLHKMVTQPVDSSRANAWKETLSRDQIADFESVAGKLLSKLDYEVTGFKVPLSRKLTREFIQSIRPYILNKLSKIIG
jgi:Sulfotransferase family